MAYAELSDVLNDAPNIKLGVSTKPSLAQAETLTAEVNNEVDVILAGLGYTVPVTGPQSVALLKKIVISGAIAKILKAMFFGVRDPNDVGANDAWREYQGQLKALIDPNNPFGLPDAQTNIQVQKVTSEMGYYIQSESDQAFRPTRDQVF